jgi:hypothetical protein
MSIAFAVEFELGAPILIDRGINLAGLLARLIFDRDDPDPLPKVPLESRDGILAGSDLFVVAPALSYPLTYVRSLRPTAMQHDLALRNRRGRRMPIVRLRDEMKNLLDQARTFSGATRSRIHRAPAETRHLDARCHDGGVGLRFGKSVVHLPVRRTDDRIDSFCDRTMMPPKLTSPLRASADRQRKPAEGWR